MNSLMIGVMSFIIISHLRFSKFDKFLNYSTNIKVEQIIFSSFHESTTLHPPSLSFPVYYVVVDEASSSVIVSLRGTNSFSDLMTVRSFLVKN